MSRVARYEKVREVVVGGYRYEARLVWCGKSNCGRCPHGPYWWKRVGKGERERWVYVGKKLPGGGEESGEVQADFVGPWVGSSVEVLARKAGNELVGVGTGVELQRVVLEPGSERAPGNEFGDGAAGGVGVESCGGRSVDELVRFCVWIEQELERLRASQFEFAEFRRRGAVPLGGEFEEKVLRACQSLGSAVEAFTRLRELLE